MRILLVEDDPVLAWLAAATLADHHEVIGPAYDASQAMLLASEYAADIAFVDVNLNGHDEGIALARSLLLEHGITSLFISGQVCAARAHADAALGLLRKPYAPEDLNHCAQIAQAIMEGRPFGCLQHPGSLEIFSAAPKRLPSDDTDEPGQ
jgi:CheY-like chemotaxis protein